MRNSPETERTRHFGILLFEGFSNLCLANAVEPLRAANTLTKRGLYSWRHLGFGAGPVTSSSGLPVQVNPMTSTDTGDYLFVMPSYGYLALDRPATRQSLRAADQRYGALAGLDSGSWLLAAAGLLKGRRATTHWDLLTELSETFPDVDVVEDRYVMDGDRISCGGATTTLELMLALIEGHHGAGLALEVAALFMHGERDPKMDPAMHLPADRIVRAAAAVMRRNAEKPLDIASLARAIGTSQRTLERVFRRETRQSPSAVYRRIRLAEARRRMETTRESVAEIANRCGYADPTAMTRAFKAEYGLTPMQVRQAERD